MPTLTLSEFAERLNEIFPVLIREFHRQKIPQLEKHKITLPQFLILKFLSREGKSQMNALAHFMNVSTAAMTGMVERLVRDGFVLRQHETKDRRIILVRLTARGKALVKNLSLEERHTLVHIFGKISEQDRKDYLRILQQIKTTLLDEK
ncbi:MAG: MarR family transcriptional regulator [Candidatus Omnitrophica bacterium]|nr:MarR family transcriptional regulator [Candidatus Omnitrophota bacterium]